jgi:aryl-alcohol dehydrogenase-like predicted oxidoreductase
MIAGYATPHGTDAYARRLAERVAREHFRRVDGGVKFATLGLGTYLGREDDTTDALYRAAVMRALERGVNVIDTAINYRHQRSERAVGVALAQAIAGDRLRREEVVVATKGGFIPFDADMPQDAGAWFTATYLDAGIVQPDAIVGGTHCMSPRYLADQIDRSRANLGLETIDVYYLHNPETQLEEVSRAEFRKRVQAAFGALEQAVRDGKIARYGTATWDGYRVDPGATAYLSLAELVTLAREIAGPDHHLKVVQLPYNLAMPEAFTRANQLVGGDTVTLIEAARRLDVYVVASASVYQGQLTRNLPDVLAGYLPGLETDAQRAIQFVRSTPGIGTALVGMKSVAHVEENALVARLAPLPWEQFQRMFSAA